MPITPKTQIIKRELVPAGNHIARLYQIIEIGTTYFEWQGQPQESYKVRLTWELPKLTKVFNEEKGPQSLVISEEYTLSLGKKSNLRPIVEGMVGPMSDDEANNFNLEILLGKECLLNVGHDVSQKTGNKFEKVMSTSPVIEGLDIPIQVNQSKSLSYDNFNEELFNSLPSFIKEKMEKTPEYKKMKGITNYPAEDINPEDIPF